MSRVLLDTHSWAWSLNPDPRLSGRARRVLDEASAIFVSPISFFEIGLKFHIGKWPEMGPFVGEMSALLARQGGGIAEFTPEIALLAASLDWPHRDPFDRMIAASAMHLGVPLVSADTAFDGLDGRSDWPGRIW